MEYRYCPVCSTKLEIRVHGGQSRRACASPACRFVHWDNPIPVVAAVVERENHIVLVRNLGWPEKWYGLVSGFLERGESAEDGIVREVKEEIGLSTHLVNLIGVYSFRRMNQVIMAYHIVPDAGDIIIDPTEIADYRTIPISQVRPWRAGTGYALRDFLATRGFHPDFL